MSQVDFDDALLLMNVIKAAAEHGNYANAIAAAAMSDLATINTAAMEELKKAAAPTEAAGQTGNTDLGSEPEPEPEPTPTRRA